MRTAVNTPLWKGDAKRAEQTFDIHTFLKDARDTGYEGVELNDPGAHPDGNGDVHLTLKEYGLEAAALFATITANPWPPNVEDYRRRLDDAQALGVSMICVCGGFMGNQRRNTLPQDYDLFAQSIGPMVDYAGERGLTIAFHPHRGCIVETLAEMQEMLHRVPDLRVCADIAHLESCGEDAAAFIRTLADKIVYTHIKDYHWGDDTFCPLGQGDGRLDVAACIKTLQEVGHDGWLTVELDRKWNRDDPSAREYASLCRRYLADRCGLPLPAMI